MLGKEKCRMLKEIRQRIADENEIPYITRECGFQGACKGTCPKCESELRYLEQQLALRQSLGKRVAVTALCATLALAGSACGPSEEKEPETGLAGRLASVEDQLPDEEVEVEMGEVAVEDEQEPEEFELMGAVLWIPEDGEEGNG